MRWSRGRPGGVPAFLLWPSRKALLSGQKAHSLHPRTRHTGESFTRFLRLAHLESVLPSLSRSPSGFPRDSATTSRPNHHPFEARMSPSSKVGFGFLDHHYHNTIALSPSPFTQCAYTRFGGKRLPVKFDLLGARPNARSKASRHRQLCIIVQLSCLDRELVA